MLPEACVLTFSVIICVVMYVFHSQCVSFPLGLLELHVCVWTLFLFPLLVFVDASYSLSFNTWKQCTNTCHSEYYIIFNKRKLTQFTYNGRITDVKSGCQYGMVCSFLSISLCYFWFLVNLFILLFVQLHILHERPNKWAHSHSFVCTY